MITEAQLERLCISSNNSIREALTCIDLNMQGIALVVDSERRLLGTVVDGDVRRAMLAGIDLGDPVSLILAHKAESTYPKPVTAPVGVDPEVLLQLMRERIVRQIPLLDNGGRVIGLVTWDDLVPARMLPLQAVIMAGGLGTRLSPLTEDLPKPMLPIGGRPLMELIIEQLREAGVRYVNITMHYKPEKIMEHFGDGRSFGIEVNYVDENQPLGTGGALGLMPAPQELLLVINGDILTQVNFRAMLAYHQEQRAEMTVAVRQYGLQVPYGVIECEDGRVCRLREKPQLSFLVNAGIYLLEPSVYNYIPKGQPFNMTDLIQWLLDAGRLVIGFPIHEYWLDIGQHADYMQAQEDLRKGRLDP